MDIYKEKFTKLERGILKLLCVNAGKSLNQRAISLALNASPTAVAKSIKSLENTDLINLKKDKASQTFEIKLNFENEKVFFLKRTENLKAIYDSGLAEFLFKEFPGATIILFGSYSFGEDSYNSDIDIAIIGTKEKEINLASFEKAFNKKIVIQFYNIFGKIHKNLKENILNGITLKGGIRL